MADRLAQTATNLVEYTVSELAFALRRTVEDNFGLVKLRGEISGFRGRHSSGPLLFHFEGRERLHRGGDLEEHVRPAQVQARARDSR
jgi:hypothetical protein